MANPAENPKPGEIPVCHTTDPSWASAFHLVSAVIIDAGDIIRVDGTAGTVTVLTPS